MFKGAEHYICEHLLSRLLLSNSFSCSPSMCFRCIGSKKSSNCENRLSSSPPSAPRVVETSAGTSRASARQSTVSATPSLAASALSVHSEATIQSIQSNKSIQAIARQISQDLYELEDRHTNLVQWADSLIPENYAKRSWTTEMRQAYGEYKDFCEEHAEARTDFLDYQIMHLTPGQFVERANLAVKIGEAACRYMCPSSYLFSRRTAADQKYCFRAGEARIRFLESFRDAFNHVHSIKGHIKQANDYLSAARGAIRDARGELLSKSSSGVIESY